MSRLEALSEGRNDGLPILIPANMMGLSDAEERQLMRSQGRQSPTLPPSPERAGFTGFDARNRFEGIQRTSVDSINYHNEHKPEPAYDMNAPGHQPAPVPTVKIAGTQALFGLHRRERSLDADASAEFERDFAANTMLETSAQKAGIGLISCEINEAPQAEELPELGSAGGAVPEDGEEIPHSGTPGEVDAEARASQQDLEEPGAGEEQKLDKSQETPAEGRREHE